MTCKSIPSDMPLLTHYCTSLCHPSHLHTHNKHSGQSLFAAQFPVALHVCSSMVNSRRQGAAISQSYLSSCAPFSSNVWCRDHQILPCLVILNAATVYNLTYSAIHQIHHCVFTHSFFFTNFHYEVTRTCTQHMTVVVAFLQHYQRSHVHAHTHIYTLRMHDWCDCYTSLLYEITEVR